MNCLQIPPEIRCVIRFKRQQIKQTYTSKTFVKIGKCLLYSKMVYILYIILIILCYDIYHKRISTG